LDWSQADLANASHVSLSTVRDFEKGRRVPIANNLTAIRAALEAAGIGFAFATDSATGESCASGITCSKSLATFGRGKTTNSE
jgi:transcriptional regulator with XRE-family HTH domain